VTEQSLHLHHIALRHSLAYLRRTHLVALIAILLHLHNLQSGVLCQEVVVATIFVSEAVVITYDKLLYVEFAYDIVVDKCFVRECRKGSIEGYHDKAVDTYLIQQQTLLFECGEYLYPTLTQHQARVRLECHDNTLSATLTSATDNLDKKFSVTTMYAIIRTYRSNSSAQWRDTIKSTNNPHLRISY
jgi:hypothetical protein